MSDLAHSENKGDFDGFVSLEFRPDWVKHGTAKQLEEYMGGGSRGGSFKFLGPGWYFGKVDAMIIVPQSFKPDPAGTSPYSGAWRSKDKWPEDTMFVLSYYSENPTMSFNAIVNAPTRTDNR